MTPRIETVLHPTDFSPASDVAFAHALAIALVSHAQLTLLHAGARVVENWQRFPGVRRTLEGWGVLAPDSPRKAVMEELNVAVTKIDMEGDPLRVCAEYVASEEPDLIVLATAGRKGLTRWVQPAVARRSGSLMLCVPEDCRPMVALEDGTLALSRILVPVDHLPDAGPALRHATRLARDLGTPPVSIRGLHVGERAPELPKLDADPAWLLRLDLTRGEVVDTILEEAADADLVVMATDGRDGPLDVFRGSNTERVVRQASCPVLAVPSV